MSEETGQKLTDPSRIGDIAEYYAITWLWDIGDDVFKNCGCTGPIDIVAINDKGETILIDVKTMGKYPDGVYRNKRVRTAKQKELGVKLLAFNPVTRKLTFIESKGDRQRELF